MVHTRQSAAAKLQISIDTLDRAIRRGELSIVKIGSCVRITDESLEQFMQRNTVCRTCGRSPKEVISAELAAMGKPA